MFPDPALDVPGSAGFDFLVIIVGLCLIGKWLFNHLIDFYFEFLLPRFKHINKNIYGISGFILLLLFGGITKAYLASTMGIQNRQERLESAVRATMEREDIKNMFISKHLDGEQITSNDTQDKRNGVWHVKGIHLILKDVRALYPEYNDMTDYELSTAIHRARHAVMPYQQFARSFGGPLTEDGRITLHRP